MMVHILSEVVVLVGLTFYFNQKNKKLMAHIEDLAQRVEEQEDLLQKHDQIIKQVVDHIGKQQAMMQQKVIPSVVSQARSSPRRKVRSKRRTPQQSSQPPVRVHFAPEPQKAESESESESESDGDLDAELEEELNDLVEPDDNLKKESQLKKDA